MLESLLSVPGFSGVALELFLGTQCSASLPLDPQIGTPGSRGLLLDNGVIQIPKLEHGSSTDSYLVSGIGKIPRHSCKICVGIQPGALEIGIQPTQETMSVHHFLDHASLAPPLQKTPS